MLNLLTILYLLPVSSILCETGSDAWLRYPPVPTTHRHLYANLPDTAVTLTDSPVITSSVQELTTGLKGLLDIDLQRRTSVPTDQTSIIIAPIDALKGVVEDRDLPRGLTTADGYHIGYATVNNTRHVLITGRSAAGALYGTFALLRHITLYKPIEQPVLNETSNPYQPVRYANQWDNLSGSIERGYGGKSIYFANDNVVDDLSRAERYARLLASVGVNGCAVNNVNVNVRIIKSDFLPQLQHLSRVFSKWAVRVLLSVDFASPESVGGLKTYDPLDSRVIEFWQNKTDEIYRYVPDLAGYVLKADAEGRPGPSKYNRTAAQAGNALGRALAPHGGLLFYRGFVYGYPIDWKNLTADRAVAAYRNFAALDGKFDDNVIVQIKYGPLDFHVREAISPLLGALRRTNVALEVEVTQEYTGQQRHTVWLAAMWKWVLDFDLRPDGQSAPVKRLVSGRHFDRPVGGLVGVVNVGRDVNWMGNHMAMANVWALGRLAWNPDESLHSMADVWTRLTFGHNQRVVDTVVGIQTQSYGAYENYTGPLGAGSFTDVPDSKYGPNIMSTEGSHAGWGQFHRADHQGIGVDRTVAGLQGKYGSGFIGEYSADLQPMYESVDSCPDNLLLFMHHVNYTHVLHSGKTVIQHIYDSHYSGAQTAQQFYRNWLSLKGLVDERRYEEIARQLHYQSGHSVVWRDAICQWFSKTSGIDDNQHRVGHYSGRIEAETMRLTGYVNITVNPWETASGALAVECKASGCRAQTEWTGVAGVYDIAVQYYDENDGQSAFKLYVGQRVVSEWVANTSLPNGRPCGDTSTRFTAPGVELKAGDVVAVETVPNGKENAVLDYIEILRPN